MMMERIRLLYEQARLQAKSIDADIDPKGWMDLYHQKFAELIVEECAELVETQHTWITSVAASALIRKHFGVEE
jgi:hypothetical protein